jgi:protein-S-isoprenylcysteine O-methyltransferase Ste14
MHLLDQRVPGIIILFLLDLLVVNPVAALLLVSRRLALIDPARVAIHPPWLLPTQSWIFFAEFVIYLLLILLLVPMEENGLRQAYGEHYAAYRQKTKKLIPYIY